MKFYLLTLILFTLMISPAFTQPGRLGGTAIVSPEVFNDGRVTFRLWAP